MEQPKKIEIISQIPLFAGLSAEEKGIIDDYSSLVEYKKNQVIYQQGSPADAFYCVAWGRVVVYGNGPAGQEVILEYLHRGKYFGIISLLTSEPHSVTAKAVNDSLLLVIKKEDFDLVIKRIPALAIDISSTLSRRLKNKDLHPKRIFESEVISVFSSYSQAGKTVYALNLALSLREQTKKAVIILDICPAGSLHSLPHKLDAGVDCRPLELSSLAAPSVEKLSEHIFKSSFGVDLFCLSYNEEEKDSTKKLLDILSILINDYHYLILDLPALMDNFVFSVLNQSDLIHVLTSPQPVDLRKTRHLISRMKDEFAFQENKIKVIVNEYKFAKITPEEERVILGHPVYATLPKIEFVSAERLVLDNPEAEYSRAVRRICRQTAEAFVGLALGVGFGYGFCHIGILKVFEEEKIPVDVIVGSSIGAAVAALWASGYSADQIIEIVRKEFKEPKYTFGMLDFTFPMFGFIKGNKLYRFLKKYLGNKTFYDIKLPLKIVASDIHKKESRILDKGLLIDAVMASCSMPGVFQPFRAKEDVLFDGGVVNPLPTDLLVAMGIKKIIAVNVTPSREDILGQYEKIKEDIARTKESLKKRNWFNLKQIFRERFKTNILEIVFSSIELMQSQMIARESLLADIVLHPDTSGLHWLELYRVAEFAQRGEAEARKNLEKIKQIVNG